MSRSTRPISGFAQERDHVVERVTPGNLWNMWV
jgi:hypothetical protein